MRKALAVLALMFCSVTSSPAQVSFGLDSPDVSIGINLPVYPELVRIPGYPVYYAPQLDTNYFFYDGLYWVFDGANWYASTWYNGPWQLVTPDAVPLYLLRVPVRYYREPPVYFRGWARDAAPRWGSHWGDRWARNHRGWDRWNRAAAPAPAPLPTYQRRYTGNRYPGRAEQRTLESRNYRYQPRDRSAEQRLGQRPVINAQANGPSGRFGPRQNDRTRSEHATVQRPNDRTQSERMNVQRSHDRAQGERPNVQRFASPAPAQRATPPLATHRAPATPPLANGASGTPPVASHGAPAAHRPAASLAEHGRAGAPQARAEARGPQGRGPAHENGPAANAHARGERRQPHDNG